MNFTSKYVLTKIKKGIIYSFSFGFLIGCVPNKFHLQYYGKKYNIHSSICLPLVSGLICSTIFLFSPFIMINYIFNGVFFDKLTDNLLNKYDVDIIRYHQYGNDLKNKYAFPSSFHLTIKYLKNQ